MQINVNVNSLKNIAMGEYRPKAITLNSVTDATRLSLANMIMERAKYYAPVSSKASVNFEKDSRGVYTGEFEEVFPGRLRDNIRVEEYTKLVGVRVIKPNGMAAIETSQARGYVVVSDVWYSIYVHELTNNRHKEPTKAKYLETAAIEISNMMGDKVYLSIEYGSPPNGYIKVYIDDIMRGNRLV